MAARDLYGEEIENLVRAAKTIGEATRILITARLRMED